MRKFIALLCFLILVLGLASQTRAAESSFYSIPGNTIQIQDWTAPVTSACLHSPQYPQDIEIGNNVVLNGSFQDGTVGWMVKGKAEVSNGVLTLGDEGGVLGENEVAQTLHKPSWIQFSYKIHATQGDADPDAVVFQVLQDDEVLLELKAKQLNSTISTEFQNKVIRLTDTDSAEKTIRFRVGNAEEDDVQYWLELKEVTTATPLVLPEESLIFHSVDKQSSTTWYLPKNQDQEKKIESISFADLPETSFQYWSIDAYGNKESPTTATLQKAIPALQIEDVQTQKDEDEVRLTLSHTSVQFLRVEVQDISSSTEVNIKPVLEDTQDQQTTVFLDNTSGNLSKIKLRLRDEQGQNGPWREVTL